MSLIALKCEGGPIRVLIITPVYWPSWEYGGIVLGTHGTCKSLVDKGHQVTVITTDGSSKTARCSGVREVIDGVNVIRHRNISNLLAWNRIFLPFGLTFRIVAEIMQADIIHIIDLRFIGTVEVFIANTRKPFVITPLNPFKFYNRKDFVKDIFDRVIGKRILKEASAIIAQSDAEKESFIELGIEKDNIHILPLGHSNDIQEIFSELDIQVLKKKIGFENQDFLLFIGRLDHVKGPDILIDAHEILCSRLAKPIGLVIAGPDAGYETVVREKVKKSKYEQMIRMIGPIIGPEKTILMDLSSIVVVPSRFEEFGLVPLEAASIGKPVIITKNCGINNWFRDCFDIVNPDPLSLAEIIEEKLGLLDSLESKRKINEARKIASTLTYPSISEKTITLYDRAINAFKNKQEN